VLYNVLCRIKVKGLVHPKIKLLSVITLAHVVLDLIQSKKWRASAKHLSRT